MNHPWLEQARRLIAIAQNGLAYTQDTFDRERYSELRTLGMRMLASSSDVSPSRLQELWDTEVGPATPKADVRGALLVDDAILLVRERSDGLWSLPGGWAEVGESPGEAVAREVYEESGYQVRATKLLAVYDRARHEHSPYPFATYILFFRCELVGGSPTQSPETDAVAFFRQEELPPFSTYRITAGQVARLFEHYRHPDWPTDFD